MTLQCLWVRASLKNRVDICCYNSATLCRIVATGSMSVNGYLSDCSLPEVFQLLQDGKKTGLLSIQGLASPDQVQSKYYFIWLHRGRIVTITTRLDSRGLAALISRRRYLSPTMTERLIRRCPVDEPL